MSRYLPKKSSSPNFWQNVIIPLVPISAWKKHCGLSKSSKTPFQNAHSHQPDQVFNRVGTLPFPVRPEFSSKKNHSLQKQNPLVFPATLSSRMRVSSPSVIETSTRSLPTLSWRTCHKNFTTNMDTGSTLRRGRILLSNLTRTSRGRRKPTKIAEADATWTPWTQSSTTFSGSWFKTLMTYCNEGLFFPVQYSKYGGWLDFDC